MPPPAPLTRKTRFVCVSDTHNACPNGAFKLPEGDVLIHAGDLTNQGSLSELQKTLKWIEEADFEAKIVIAGNHDITLDTSFYKEYGLYFHNQNPQDPTKCQNLMNGSSSIIYLQHEAAVIKLSAVNGPRTTFKVFGSPFSPANGMWAFSYDAAEAAQIWDKIPFDTDVVITHTPPKYHCDERSDRRSVGCEALRRVLWRVRPRLAICGHVHESRGAEVIKWDLGALNVKYKEDTVKRWTDPGKENKKQSLVDLTVKSGKTLDNDGSIGDAGWAAVPDDDMANRPPESMASRKPQHSSIYFSGSSVPVPSNNPFPDSTISIDDSVIATGSDLSTTYGQGGMPPSRRCDLAALSGRLGRRETCIINAAIMASSWPHNRGGGKKFNKPVVVDIDLPVWDAS